MTDILTTVERADVKSGNFARVTEPFRRELLVHCYRMLGSVDEAEDVLQETYPRAWRSYGGFEGRSSLRVWLYRIATNACLTALQHRTSRALPSGLAGPSDDPDGDPDMGAHDVQWLEPMPDALAIPEADDPAVVAGARAGLRLALIASFHHLPARQRAVLILRDALDMPASEVAQMLDTSTAAVKSTLQRARARLEHVAPKPEEVSEPSRQEARGVLDQYIAAFETGDLQALERVLRDDATLEMTLSRTWFAGKRDCMRFIARFLSAPGLYRMLPMTANGQPAAAAYRLGPAGAYEAFALVVLTTTSTEITRIILFCDPKLFAKFGAPATHPGRSDA